MAIQIASVASRAGKFTNNKDLSAYPAVAIFIRDFEADHKNSNGNPKYFDKGESFKTEDRLIGDFLFYDAEGNNVGAQENTLWAASKNTIRSLKELVGQVVVVEVVKPGDYWNVNNVGGPLLEAVVKHLNAREAELQAAMDDAPSFDD